MSIRLEAIDDNLLNVHDGSFAGPLLYRKETDLSFSVDAILRDESCWCLFNDRVVNGVMKAQQCSVLVTLDTRFSFL
jgi:hypothetical protein